MGDFRMTEKRMCRQNCRFYKKIIFGHGWGESKCIISGHEPPLNKECGVSQSVFEKELRKSEMEFL